MKISIFTTIFFSGHSKFGISNAAYFLAKNMAEKYNAEVSVYSIITSNQPSSEKRAAIYVKRFDSEMKGFLFSHKMLLEPRSRPEIIHSFHYGYFPSTAGFLSAVRMKTPHLFTPAFHPPIYTLPKKLLSYFYHIFQGYPILKYSNRVMVFSHEEKKMLERHVNRKYDIIPCHVDREVFYPDRNERGKIRIGFIGPMLPWKGAKIAADIFTEIEKERKDVEFVFVGFGRLEDEIRRCNRDFKFYREVSPQKIAAHLNSMDILVSPTKYESFGYILAEAGMCGTPVVSTRVGAVPETVGNGGITVEYGDWEGMKNQIKYLIDDNRRRRLLGKRAIKHTKQFRDDIVSGKVYRVYKSL